MPDMLSSMLQLTDADIIARLTVVEDATVERKTASDLRDVAKAATAFSNSMPVGESAIIYVGVRNDGQIEDGLNLESLQKKVSGEISNVYPPIYPQIIVRENGGRKFIAIIVEGSETRPHFAGKSYIRDGTQTVEASAKSFQELIDKRSSKTNEILKWIGKQIRLNMSGGEKDFKPSLGYISGTGMRKLVGCNQFYVTLQNDMSTGRTKLEAISLRRVEISFDYALNCLTLELWPM